MPYHDECAVCQEEFKCLGTPCSCLVSVQAFVWLGGEERLMSNVPMYFCGAECVEKHLYELRESCPIFGFGGVAGFGCHGNLWGDATDEP